MKAFLLVVLLLAGALVGVGALTSPEYSIERKIDIRASTEAVHSLVGELRRWPEWTPWADSDPTMRTEYGETTSGVGAHQSWTGADGKGKLTLTRCDPDSGIEYDMAFVSAEGRVPTHVVMNYSAQEDMTRVTWKMQGSWAGTVPAVMAGWMKILSPWMIGGKLETGLRKLKMRAEALYR